MSRWKFISLHLFYLGASLIFSIAVAVDREQEYYYATAYQVTVLNK